MQLNGDFHSRLDNLLGADEEDDLSAGDIESESDDHDQDEVVSDEESDSDSESSSAENSVI